uniref:Putative DNA polymerase n=1 Tax=viral metagenome TaxID=1070528 RepID=A0A6H1ZLF5_9ZZZZ
MIVLDIETYRADLNAGYEQWKIVDKVDKRLKDPEKIAESKERAKDKFGLSPLTGTIILVGMLSTVQYTSDWVACVYEDEALYTRIIGLDGKTETELINETLLAVSEELDNGGRLITYNGKLFDLPFIMGRAILNNIAPPSYMPYDIMINKYRSDKHIDIYNVLNEGSLVEWSYRLGMSNSLERDNAKIAQWYHDKEYQLIIDKNIIDLYQTYGIYKRIKGWVQWKA